jgi:voltage-dependent potassium channel beta subunit
MQYQRLGRSGLRMSRVSFGSWVSFDTQINDKTADELMGIAYDSGINYFDNAETYANGESERMMGRVLKGKHWDRTSFMVSSKVFFGCHGTANKPNQMGLSRKHVIEACHEALQRLQVDYLDLYFCHFPDINTPVEETVLAMNTLIQQGKILYWGTSQWSGVEIMEAHRIAEKYRLIGPTMEQPEYNLLERQRVEKEFLPIYQNVGLGTTIWSPLASGLLTGKYNEGLPAGSRLALKGYEWVREKYFQEGKLERVRKMTEYAKKIGLAPAVLAIAWCLKNPNVSTAILGATKKEQLKQNLSALDAVDKLTPEVMKELDNIMQNNPLHVKN